MNYETDFKGDSDHRHLHSCVVVTAGLWVASLGRRYRSKVPDPFLIRVGSLTAAVKKNMWLTGLVPRS